MPLPSSARSLLMSSKVKSVYGATIVATAIIARSGPSVTSSNMVDASLLEVKTLTIMPG